MLKPFYIKKKNIDNRLLPPATAADAGKLVGVTEGGNFGLVEDGGGGGSSHVVFLDSISLTERVLCLPPTYSLSIHSLTERTRGSCF